jgi:hypothetical protein
VTHSCRPGLRSVRIVTFSYLKLHPAASRHRLYRQTPARQSYTRVSRRPAPFIDENRIFVDGEQHRANTVARTLRANLGFLSGHLIFAYALNYFLFPRYVLKGKFFSAFVGLVVILAISLAYLRFADVYITHYSGNTSMWGRYNYPRAMLALFSIGWRKKSSPSSSGCYAPSSTRIFSSIPSTASMR